MVCDDRSRGGRNGMLICIKVLFSHARARNCLPAEQMTAAEQLKKVKIKNDDVAVFTPAEMRTILHAAPMHLVPILALGAFTGIRMAELNRLDWSAVDLERGIIELRAGQAFQSRTTCAHGLSRCRARAGWSGIRDCTAR